MGKKWHQLQWIDRIKIEAYLKEGHSAPEIATLLGVHRCTIYAEIKRGSYEHLTSEWETETQYSPDLAQKKYEENLTRRGANLKIGKNIHYANYIEDKIVKDNYSPEAVLGELKRTGREVDYGVTVCTRTLYNYIDKGIFYCLTNKNLPVKGTKKREYKKIKRQKRLSAGPSIEERPREILTREEFGHWEMDSVLGSLGVSKNALLVFTERKTRMEIVRKVPDHSAASVVKELDQLEKEWKGNFTKVFKTITVDNGTEFSNYQGMIRSCLDKRRKRTVIFYCHPYSSYERGSNENQNKMVRRKVPKGSNFDKRSANELCAVGDWINHYPRRMFNYQTSEELFQEELKKVL